MDWYHPQLGILAHLSLPIRPTPTMLPIWNGWLPVASPTRLNHQTLNN